jgi:hypothetical protein
VSALFVSLTALAAVGVSAHMAWRDHARAIKRRTALFDGCLAEFSSACIFVLPTGFPRLEFDRDGGRVHAELISDNMTIRRLPQLWLSVTHVVTTPDLPSFAILVRPSGGDDYALVHRFERRLEPPPGLPAEIIVRGDGSAAQVLIDRLADRLAAILADPRVKEVVVTPCGLRITTQSSEGRRGEHLLLRQAVFDDAEVAPEAVGKALTRLATLREALPAWTIEEIAA